ncbi:protein DETOXIFICATION 2-like [Hibiscus syriacus]|uniref:protein DETOXIFICATION 2-like n=1 Tax=Hibiscus syriacus TaxID=106335 RepID=UPI001922C98E|nr:protein DETOXIFICATION 2-like [Hibiscus syriacus]
MILLVTKQAQIIVKSTTPPLRLALTHFHKTHTKRSLSAYNDSLCHYLPKNLTGTLIVTPTTRSDTTCGGATATALIPPVTGFVFPHTFLLGTKSGLGAIGAAFLIGLSTFLNVISLALSTKFSSKCDKTRSAFSKEVFHSTRVFFRFAIPSAAMVCLEWWGSEVLIFLSGLLPNPELEASVLSICLAVTYLHFFIPYGIGTTTRRISRPRFSTFAVTYWGVHSAARKKSDHVADIVPIVCLTIILDGLQAVLSGVARGCWRQKMAAIVNVGAYLIGSPLGAVLAFVLHFKVKGLSLD